MSTEACSCGQSLSAPRSLEYHVSHLRRHLLAYSKIDRTTAANLSIFVTEYAREGCCGGTRKPCSYHEGFIDAIDILTNDA